MKIVFNCTNNTVGGGIQNAANFIAEAVMRNLEDEFLYLSSPQVANLVRDISGNELPENLIVLNKRGINSESGKSADRELDAFKPDVAYTMAGPTYIRFKCPHLLGISDGYITHLDFLALKKGRSFSEIIKLLPKIFAKGVLSRLQADGYVFQTEYARRSYCRRYMLSAKKTYVVPNALGSVFHGLRDLQISNEIISSQKVSVFCPAADYPHKNLSIILPLIDLFNAHRKDIEVEFVVTVPFDSSLMVGKCFDGKGNATLKNIGPFPYCDAPGLYSSSDVVLVPSVFETFSTSYLEAIAVRKPLVVADRPFSRDICKNAAFYFNHNDPQHLFTLLCSIIDNQVLVNEVEGDEVLNRYGSQVDKFDKAMNVMYDFHKRSCFS